MINYKRYLEQFIRLFVNYQCKVEKLFSCKNISQIASKTFAKHCFLTDHLNQKILNKTTCRTHSANSRQLGPH